MIEGLLSNRLIQRHSGCGHLRLLLSEERQLGFA